MIAVATMNIRGLTKADFDFITSVLDEWWGGPAVQRADPMFYYELGEHALVAELDRNVVGFLFGLMVPSTSLRLATGYVHLVGIHPNHRRRGVGQALYSTFTEHALMAGMSRIKVLALDGHEGPRKFHDALGFASNLVPDYAGSGRSRVVFTKEL